MTLQFIWGRLRWLLTFVVLERIGKWYNKSNINGMIKTITIYCNWLETPKILFVMTMNWNVFIDQENNISHLQMIFFINIKFVLQWLLVYHPFPPSTTNIIVFLRLCVVLIFIFEFWNYNFKFQFIFIFVTINQFISLIIWIKSERSSSDSSLTSTL